MFKTLFYSLIFILSWNLSQAQHLIPLNESQYLSQINTQIASHNQDSIGLRNHLLLVEYWAPIDSIQSYKALQTVLKSPKAKQLHAGLIAYYQGVYYANQGQKDKAKTQYKLAIKQLKPTVQTSDILLKAWYNYAYLQIEEKGYDIMVETLTEHCIPLSKKYNNLEALAYYYTQLGLVFMSVGQLNTAQEYHDKALTILDQIQPQTTVHLITYLNLVSNYCYKPDSETAKIYLDQATSLLKGYPNSQYYPNYYYQVAMYYTTKQDFKNALQTLYKGIESAKSKKQNRILNMLYFRLHNVYLMQKEYTKAKDLLEHILKENIIVKEPVNRKITYTQLASVNEVLNDYKSAYTWLKKANVLTDSLHQQKLFEKMNQLEIQLQTAEKQQEIDQLEQEKKQNELKVKNKNLRLIVLLIALILCVIIAFLTYLTFKKQKKLNKQIKLTHEEQLLSIENERKYEATQSILQGEEQERQRIAQDLHDSMGGILANIRMTLSKDLPHGEPKLDLLGKLDYSISEMRRIARNLMPETLKNLGLETALKELCESMSHKQLPIQFEAFDVQDTIDFQTQLALYRIAQEAISNVFKYAQASSIIVQISQNDAILHLTIEDNGIGFDLEKITYGLGLKNIANRVKWIGGHLEINSAPGEGTTLNIECHV
ncbi:ATP-binding protein [Myroides odoratus]|uniref:tetratricopeptide repeat-containing sensor histidine kinase n=1 Tax=Myroides odoratus TaxID=256 RepID=UPI0039B124FC